MSAPTSQADRLRTAADQLEKVMRGRFDAINPNDLPPLLREAADTIDDLCNRLTDTCRNIAVLNADGTSQYYFVCSACGLAVDSYLGVVRTDYVTRKDGTKDYQTFCVGDRYEFERCPSCGRRVV